jgi:hypothetical protein
MKNCTEGALFCIERLFYPVVIAATPGHKKEFAMFIGTDSHLRFSGQQLYECSTKQDRKRIMDVNTQIAKAFPCKVSVKLNPRKLPADRFERVVIIQREPLTSERSSIADMAELLMRNIMGDLYLGTIEDPIEDSTQKQG